MLVSEGVVRCGAVWCGVVRWGVVGCGVRCGVVRSGVVRCGGGVGVCGCVAPRLRTWSTLSLFMCARASVYGSVRARTSVSIWVCMGVYGCVNVCAHACMGVVCVVIVGMPRLYFSHPPTGSPPPAAASALPAAPLPP